MIVENYTFNATAKEITFADLTSLAVEGIKIITNVTTGVMIYQFNEATLLGVVSGNVLTLTFDTSLMSDSDKLMIIYEEPRVLSLESEVNVLQDLLATMKQIRKHLEPIATQDAVQRQRVVVESLTGFNANVGTANLGNINTITQGGTAPTVGTYTVQQVWEGPVDQRYRVADAARTAAYIQRQNLIFS